MMVLNSKFIIQVQPTIALAVVVDALFALWGAWLKGEAND